MTLPDSITSKEAEFEKIVSIKVDVLQIVLGNNIRGNKKLELRVPMKLFTESEISYFNKSMLSQSHQGEKPCCMTLFTISVVKEK